MDRDWPVPMDELREASVDQLLEPIRQRTEEIGADIWNELAAMGLALIDLARFERLLTIANALDENWPIVRGFAERYIAYEELKYVEAIERALVARRPGDFDPLP